MNLNPSDYLSRAPAKSSILSTGEHVSPTIHRCQHISSSDTPRKGSEVGINIARGSKCRGNCMISKCSMQQYFLFCPSENRVSAARLVGHNDQNSDTIIRWSCPLKATLIDGLTILQICLSAATSNMNLNPGTLVTISRSHVINT
jgi:hypothetical protein